MPPPSQPMRTGGWAMSDDYTPSMASIRNYYANDGAGEDPDLLAAFDRWLAHHDAELRQQVAREIRAMGSESWDGYTPDEVPGTVAARIAEGPTTDRVESR